jgi:hypothetical protein
MFQVADKSFMPVLRTFRSAAALGARRQLPVARSALMKLFKFLTIFAVVLVAAGVLAQTQYPTAKVNVPFEFTAGELTLSAGDYTIVVVRSHQIKLVGPTETVFLNTGHKLPTDITTPIIESKLLFTEVAGKHVLHQVWIEGHSQAFDITHVSTTPDIP